MSDNRFFTGTTPGRLSGQNTNVVIETKKLNDFHQQVQAAIQSVRAGARQVAVLYIGLEKTIDPRAASCEQSNKTILGIILDHLYSVLDESNAIVRMGPDQYIVLLPDVVCLYDVDQTALDIVKRFSQPFAFPEGYARKSASIGIGVFPDDGKDAESLIVGAHEAMLFAQYSGGERHQFGTGLSADAIDERLVLMADIGPAIRRREFEIDYQPRIDASCGRIASMEALVRWRHPVLGMIEPDRFIPIAESNNAIVELDEWILYAALKRMKIWIDAGLEPGKLAVNVSARQLRDPAFVDIVLRALSVSGVPAEKLELELTESFLIADMPATIAVMNELNEIGVQFAIDDFGTGFASLDYLRQLPIRAVKIDQSFIQNIATGLRDAAFVRAVIAMIADLGLKVVAEGVENLNQLNSLRGTACNEFQGFVFCRPLTASAATDLLHRRPAFTV